MKSKNYLLLGVIFTILFGLKLVLNSLLLAENGDTYDFFKIAYSIQNNNWLYESKRMPFLPLLLSIFPSEYFVWVGRVWINVFYFLSVFLFFKIIKLVNQLASLRGRSGPISSPRFAVEAGKLVNYLPTAIFATNIIILENSFYILADTVFLFFNLLFIYFVLSKKDNPIFLATITALAFYTRPEGFILAVVTFVYYLTQKKLRSIFYYIVIISVLLTPHFLRNYILTKNIFSSGYFNDAAGFIFDLETVLKRISNFFFITGGVFLLPLTILLVKVDFKKVKQIIVDPIFLIFLLNSIILFLWGPYPRLYSILATILIIFLTKMIFENQKSNKTRAVIAFIFFILLTFFYIYVSQNLSHKDFGYKKYSKLASIVISFAIVTLPIIKTRLKISYYQFILIISLSVITLNLVVFFEKFNYTRHKYYSIKNCVEKYIELESNEKLAYSTLSGVEEWYLKDDKKQYQYLGDTKQFENWRIENNINYLLTSSENGYKDNLGHIGLTKYTNHKVLCETKTPFFEGSTKLVQLD